VLKDYLSRTAKLRGQESYVLLSYRKPHVRVTKDTVSRWIKTAMAKAGIDVQTFKPHSTRSASTSKAMSKDVPINIILSTAGWSNAGTFQKFYHKNQEQKGQFARKVLEG
jgi:site-specific recombinase XerD